MAVGGLRAGVEPFIEQLAAPTATPGGGSAAAAAAPWPPAWPAWWRSMSRGKKAYLQYESQLSEAIARLTPLREELKAAIDADAESYNVVMKAYKAAKESADGGSKASTQRSVRQPACLSAWPKEPSKWRASPPLQTDHQSQHGFRPDHRDRTRPNRLPCAR
jgi:formiminotetrahydrofolate cyclodeaminase